MNFRDRLFLYVAVWLFIAIVLVLGMLIKTVTG